MRHRHSGAEQWASVCCASNQLFSTQSTASFLPSARVNDQKISILLVHKSSVPCTGTSRHRHGFLSKGQHLWSLIISGMKGGVVWDQRICEYFFNLLIAFIANSIMPFKQMRREWNSAFTNCYLTSVASSHSKVEGQLLSLWSKCICTCIQWYSTADTVDWAQNAWFSYKIIFQK